MYVRASADVDETPPDVDRVNGIVVAVGRRASATGPVRFLAESFAVAIRMIGGSVSLFQADQIVQVRPSI